jgi:Ca2+-binding RTX toxin-like protein
MFAEHVGHGVLVHGIGTATGAASASSYGADIGLLAKNLVVYDASMAAFDFHSESRNGTYTDSLAFNSRMFGDFRGIGNTFENSGGVGNQYGIQFYEYGAGDGRDSTVANLVLRETVNYNFMISNLPQNNLVKDSWFESYGKGYNIRKDIADLTNSTVIANVTTDNDTMTGTDKADKLLGGKGVDTIKGGAGNDLIWGGAGADMLTGGTGRDRFAYQSLSEGGDHITDFKAGASGDVIDVSVLAARLGWHGSDFIASGYIRAYQSGADTLLQANSGSGWTTLATLDGVTASKFNAGNIQTLLSQGNPVGEEGVEVSKPVLSTAPVKDVSTAPATEVITAPTKDVITAPTKDAPVVVAEEISGTAGKDWFAAKAGAQIYKGSAGDDAYVFDHVGDRVLGETANGGLDTIYSSVSVNLSEHANVENLRLNDGSAINGSGNDLANVITGNKSANVISGGAGIDSLYGKGGADTFVFAEMGAAHKDSIWDFDSDDKVLLSKSVFAGLDMNNDGILDAAHFAIASKWGAAATSAGAQVIYNSASGILSYDADGVGGTAAKDIAYIGVNKAFFDHSDILIG